jgi:hypothetical protein
MNAVRIAALALLVALAAAPAKAAVPPAPAAANAPAAPAFGHAAFDSLLRRYVVEGRGVRWAAFHGNRADRAALDAYVARLAEADTAGWPPAEQMAFWINAYNALTLQRVLAAYPVPSITQVKTAPDLPAGKGVWLEPHRVARTTLTLDDIEHRVLRGRFADPRVHFVLNCAARSCPPLEARAFTGEGLDARLEAAARRFVNDARFNRIPAGGGEWELSALFDWYGADFAAAGGSVPGWLARHLAPETRRGMPPPGRIRVRFLPYDWSLNEP